MSHFVSQTSNKNFLRPKPNQEMVFQNYTILVIITKITLLGVLSKLLATGQISLTKIIILWLGTSWFTNHLYFTK